MNKQSNVNFDFPEITDRKFAEYLQLFYAKITRNPYYKYLQAETHLHLQCCQYLRWKYPDVLFHHSQNENKRSNFERWLVVLLGMKAGCPDLLIFKQKTVYLKDETTEVISGLAVELKVGKNKITDLQKDFLDRLYDNYWEKTVIYSIDEFMSYIDNYLKN